MTESATADARKALVAQRLRRRKTGPAITPRPEGEVPPLSSAQERLWFLDQYTPGETAYVIPVSRRVRGPLDPGALERAFAEVVARHEVLRMRYPADDEGRPGVVVVPPPAASAPFTVVEAAGEVEARAAVAGFLAVPFDLAEGPVIRALLVRLAPEDHVLALAIHHIAADGWSTSVLLRELFALHDGRELAPPPVGYGDYALWQRGREQEREDLDFWRRRLAGVEPLALPADHPRPPEQTYGGAAHAFRVDAATAERLTAIGHEHGATPYMTLLAAFAALLGRHSGQDDVAIGSPVGGRPLAELEGLVGCFVNMLTMRVDLSGDPTFLELLARVRDLALEAYAHQETPFERVVADLNVARDVSRSPLFQVILAMQNYTGEGGDGDGPGLEGFPLGTWATRFDLELYLSEDAEGLAGLFVYNTDLFEAATVERLTAHLTALLERVAADPSLRTSALDVLGEEERRLVLTEWNATAVPSPGETTLHALVEAQAARTPHAPAVTFEGGTLSYAELDARAERVAGALRGLGAGPGSLVGVCAERSFELVAALLGVLKTGAAYVPLDPEYPADRLAFMAGDAGLSAVLTLTPAEDSALPGEGPAGPDALRALRDSGGLAGCPVLPLDDPDAWPQAASPGPGAGPDDTAYVIYTSGSTGRPKGVANGHRGIVNRLEWMQERFSLTAQDVVLQKTPAGFDVSVWEFFWPLVTGARLVLARPGGHKDSAYLRDLITAEGVTTLHFVPSMLAVFLAEEGVADCGTLRTVVCSGEELPVDLARRCVETLPAELHNLYGPTEAAVDVSAWHCAPEALSGLARVPIGGPVANTTLYVLDAGMRPVPVGVPGELYIGGVQVAHGYVRRPALTAERFVPDPFGDGGGRLYRTGDLARWRPDGTVEFLGRIDNQVKLRGLRIELGEIEVALRARPGVTDAAVIVREDRPGDRRLVAYLVEENTPDGPAPDHRAELKRRLPDYMVPSSFVTLPSLPLTPNGKLDRSALPEPVFSREEGAVFAEPSTPTEQAIAAVWSEVLGIETIGADDDFFDLGGHSLLATQVVARLRTAVGGGVSVMDVFKHRTVRELAALVDTPADSREPRGLLHELTRSRATELSYVCVPYGGGSAVVYQPLADALPAGYGLWSVAIPGHDVGVDEERLPFDELAARCVAEIQEKVQGPIALYGHCGVGSALIVEIARRLEAEGRHLEAVYIGAIFPFARPRGGAMSRLARMARMESLRGDQGYANWLTSMGVDMSDLDPDRARLIIRNMRRDSEAAEQYFTELFESSARRLRAPIITVAGERDPATDYYQERFREWHFLTDDSAVVVLEEAGHFFLKYRAAELAEIVTGVHVSMRSAPETPASAEPGTPAAPDSATWRLHAVSHSTSAVVPTGPQPSMRRFALVASGQLVSITGSALTEFAIPIWIYLTTGSLVRFALFSVLAIVPGMLVAPLAGVIVDRSERRRIMLIGDLCAGGTQLALGLLLWTGNLQTWHLYPLIVCLSIALTFQRLAYGSAIPQLVPKRYLGHANGITQMVNGTSQLIVPIIAVGLMATIGLEGILIIDVLSYVFAVTVILFVRFPSTMAWRRRESVTAEMVEGFRYSWGNRGFRSMLVFFAILNIFLSPLFLMTSPLVLSFATLDEVGTVAFFSGLGVFLGGLSMTVWGGPRHRRMYGVLLCTLALAVSGTLIGLRPDLVMISAGAFGLGLWVSLLNGIYATIVQVKVPQRFHGRVFALNTLIAWSTMPFGFAVVGPAAAALLDPLLTPDGLLAGSVGELIGVGPGRGIALMYLLASLAIAILAVVCLRGGPLSRFDDEIADAAPDDLVGLQALRRDGDGEESQTPEVPAVPAAKARKAAGRS
ncbi:non-ribosomal peptide synthetase/MFS transporter [Planobispora takensis]|uniref:Carrier domain-containing protein n=1 Tax=Planobispora takensis TaxID=1367882 RepID=A0A8J3SWA5_9ACTN|nr:non-ribosomal peptide synthetase/MFS transporter [Planobispora takensis]GII00831.1 hypothetical protein Pta02_28390 [Planobispora takensis]